MYENSTKQKQLKSILKKTGFIGIGVFALSLNYFAKKNYLPKEETPKATITIDSIIQKKEIQSTYFKETK